MKWLVVIGVLFVALQGAAQTENYQGRIVLLDKEVRLFRGTQGEKFFIKAINKENNKLTTVGDTVQIATIVDTEKVLRKINKSKNEDIKEVIHVYHFALGDVYKLLNKDTSAHDELIYILQGKLYYFSSSSYKVHEKKLSKICSESKKISDNEMKKMLAYVQYQIFWNDYKDDSVRKNEE